MLNKMIWVALPNLSRTSCMTWKRAISSEVFPAYGNPPDGILMGGMLALL